MTSLSKFLRFFFWRSYLHVTLIFYKYWLFLYNYHVIRVGLMSVCVSVRYDHAGDVSRSLDQNSSLDFSGPNGLHVSHYPALPHILQSTHRHLPSTPNKVKLHPFTLDITSIKLKVHPLCRYLWAISLLSVLVQLFSEQSSSTCHLSSSMVLYSVKHGKKQWTLIRFDPPIVKGYY